VIFILKEQISFQVGSFTFVKQELVLEKETKMRESMLMMGCKLRVIWMTWYFKQIIFLLPSVILISIILKVS